MYKIYVYNILKLKTKWHCETRFRAFGIVHINYTFKSGKDVFFASTARERFTTIWIGRWIQAVRPGQRLWRLGTHLVLEILSLWISRLPMPRPDLTPNGAFQRRPTRAVGPRLRMLHNRMILVLTKVNTSLE